jgi:hypothetical protein
MLASTRLNPVRVTSSIRRDWMPRGKQRKGGGGVSLDRTIADLERSVEYVEKLAARLRKAAREARSGVAAASLGPGKRRGRPPGRAAAARAGGRRRGRGPGAGAMALEVLREWGKPARAGELLPELERRGVHVGGANPLATLASTLLKYRGVKRVSRGLFAPADARGPGWRPGRSGGRRAAGGEPAAETAGA